MWDFFFKFNVMSEDNKKQTKPKKYRVIKKSVGTNLSFEGEPLRLGNDLSLKKLKALFDKGIKSVIHE